MEKFIQSDVMKIPDDDNDIKMNSLFLYNNNRIDR